MEPEQSILQRIRHKELELSVEIEKVRRDGDQRIELAKKEATELIRKYGEEAENQVTAYEKKELENIETSVDSLKRNGEEEAKIVRDKGVKNLPRAVDLIVRTIAPG